MTRATAAGTSGPASARTPPCAGGNPRDRSPRPLGEANDPRLGGAQLQPQRREDRRHPPASLLGSYPASAEDDEIIGVADQHSGLCPLLLPRRIKDVESDVGEQRRDRRPLRSPRHHVGDHPLFQHPRSQPRPDQLQHLPIGHPSGHLHHQGVVVDAAVGRHDTLPTSTASRRRCGSSVRVIHCRAVRSSWWAGCAGTDGSS